MPSTQRALAQHKTAKALNIDNINGNKLSGEKLRHMFIASSAMLMLVGMWLVIRDVFL